MKLIQNFKIGILAALGAAIFLALMNSTAKILTDDLHPVIVTFWRNLIGLTILTLWMVITKKTFYIKTTRLKGHALRSIIGTIGMILSVFTLQYLALTEAMVLGFTAPLFVIFLAYPILGEAINRHRLIATFIGFSGVILTIGFNIDNINFIGTFYALLWAFTNAVVLICLRWLGNTENAITTNFYFLLIGLFMCCLYIPFSDRLLPRPEIQWLIIFIGIVGLLSLLLKTEAYRHAPANVIAPLSYTMLIWVALIDFLIWHITAPLKVWIGAVLIIGSNLFILWREQRQKTKTGTSLPV